MHLCICVSFSNRMITALGVFFFPFTNFARSAQVSPTQERLRAGAPRLLTSPGLSSAFTAPPRGPSQVSAKTVSATTQANLRHLPTEKSARSRERFGL